MNRTFAAIAAASLVLGAGALTGAAIAGDGAKGDRAQKRAEWIDRMFERADANKDGAIDKAEMDAARAARFAAADTNADGGLSLDEMKAMMGERSKRWSERKMERRFNRLDADDDGKVTQAEMAAMFQKRGDMFKRADADGDGRITRAEAEQAMNSHRHRGHGERRDRKDDGEGAN